MPDASNQRPEDGVTVLSIHLDEHDKTRVALNEGHNMAVAGAGLENRLPQWPGMARSSISAGLSRLDTALIICLRVYPAVVELWPRRMIRRLRR